MELLTAKEIAKMTFSEQKFAALETAEQRLERIIIDYAKQKCKEQQKLAKEHLFNIGQTVYLSSKKDMPYPEF